ncbi:hypothetical protein Xph01_06710 [Micromonospora phaseoli]|nr:hypothetical protein Xph01_06710 [Micromonospora phaseoli]
MRVARLVAGLTAVTTALTGLILATASPAAAAIDNGTWVAYGNKNPITSSSSTWRCGATETVATNVLAQVCAIRSASGAAMQGAVIVRNNRSSSFSTTAFVRLREYTQTFGAWACQSSGIGANGWTVCFGRTIDYRSVQAEGDGNAVYLGYSPWI